MQPTKPKTTQDTDPVALIETAPQTKKSQTFEHVENDQTHPSLISPLDGRRVGLDRSNKNKIKHNYEYDAIVIGAGPAGEAAAMKLAKSGHRVAVIDPRDQVGGNCAHVGTIPSKALRQSVFNIINFRRDPLFK